MEKISYNKCMLQIENKDNEDVFDQEGFSK